MLFSKSFCPSTVGTESEEIVQLAGIEEVIELFVMISSVVNLEIVDSRKNMLEMNMSCLCLSLIQLCSCLGKMSATISRQSSPVLRVQVYQDSKMRTHKPVEKPPALISDMIASPMS